METSVETPPPQVESQPEIQEAVERNLLLFFYPFFFREDYYCIIQSLYQNEC